MFLIRLQTTDWFKSIRAFNHLFPESAATLKSSGVPGENFSSFWTFQTLYPTDPTAMREKAQHLRALGKPFQGQGQLYGQTMDLDAVLKLLQATLEEAGIKLG